MSSYGIIVPRYRLLILVNSQVDDHVDKLLVVTPSTINSPVKIQEYEEGIHSMLLDEWHAYAIINMMFTTDHTRSVATARLLGGSQIFGDERGRELAMMIARFIMRYELRCTNGFYETIPYHLVKINGKKEEEEEEEICVICQKEFEAGEMCHALECGHWYHKECIEQWLHHKNICPICREKVF